MLSGAGAAGGEGQDFGDEYDDEGDEGDAQALGAGNPLAALAQNPNFALIRQRIL